MFTYERKFRYPLMLDLQLFAGKTATVDGQTFEIDDDMGGDDGGDADDELDDIEIDDGDDADEDGAGGDADGDDDGGEGDDDAEDDDAAEGDSDGDNAGSEDGGKEGSKAGKEGAKKDNPVAKAVIAERKRLQAQIAEANKTAAAAQKLMKMLNITDVSQLEARLDAAEAQRLAKAENIPPEQAQARIAQQRTLERQALEIRKLKYGQEVATLKADPFFADIDDHREEFEEIAERTGLSMKEVYMAKRGDVRMKEYEREVEQRTLANKQKRQKAKVDTTSNGEQIKKESYNLTPDQLAMAKAAVKMGTFKSVGEYAKMLKKRG